MFNKGIAAAEANYTVNFIQAVNTDRWKWTPGTQMMRLTASETDSEGPLATNTFVYKTA